MADDPLEEMGDGGMFRSAVIDFAGFRIAAGRSPARSRPCDHKRLTYSGHERRVWCQDCARTIDGFDAFLVLAHGFEDIVREARSDRHKAAEALKAVVVRRSAKELDRLWGRSMAPCCPHCHRGLLPEDFANGAGSAVGREFEIARRKRDATRADWQSDAKDAIGDAQHAIHQGYSAMAVQCLERAIAILRRAESHG